MVNRITDSAKAKLCLALVFITNFVLRLMVVIEERYDPVCDLEKETVPNRMGFSGSNYYEHHTSSSKLCCIALF